MTATTDEVGVDPLDLADVFGRYGADLLRYCARRVGPDHAEDVVAATFLAAVAHSDRFDPTRASPLPWLYGIATNLLRRHGRDEVLAYRALARARAKAEPRDEAETDRAVARIDSAAARQRLARALSRLPKRQRDVLLLYALADLDYAGIAEALDIPLGTVQSALHRARAKVRAALGADPLTGDDS